jgi:hypothetical protein
MPYFSASRSSVACGLCPGFAPPQCEKIPVDGFEAIGNLVGDDGGGLEIDRFVGVFHGQTQIRLLGTVEQLFVQWAQTAVGIHVHQYGVKLDQVGRLALQAVALLEKTVLQLVLL